MVAMGKFSMVSALLISAVPCQGEERIKYASNDAPLSKGQMASVHTLLDSDADGKASVSEFMQFWFDTRTSVGSKNAASILKDMDSNKDGKLTLDDILNDKVWDKYEPGSKSLADQKASETKKFKAVDADGDGSLNEVELVGFFYPDTHDGVAELQAERLIEKVDADGDGNLTVAEASSLMTAAELAELDSDGNGNLNLEELIPFETGRFKWNQALQKLFDTADKDGDHHLSHDELEGARQEMVGTPAHGHFVRWAEHHELTTEL